MPRNDDPDNASWGETFMIMWLVVQTLTPPLAFILGFSGLFIWIILALLSNPPMALIPVALTGLAIAWFARRGRKEAAKLIAERDGLPIPGGPRRPGL